MVLIGVSLLDYFENRHDKNKVTDNEVSVLEEISIFASAISPVLLPIISSLGDLEL